MAFHSVIEEGVYTPFRVETDESHQVWALIGYDPDIHVTYFAVVEMSPYDENMPEFSFHVAARCVETGSITHIHNGMSTKAILNGDDRTKVLRTICEMTADLLNWVQPPAVYRCTFDAKPPRKALGKHYILSAVFVECGYEVVRTDPWHGKIQWIYERKDSRCD